MANHCAKFCGQMFVISQVVVFTNQYARTHARTYSDAIFYVHSGELQRKIGLKVLDLGGNAVAG